MYLQQPLFHQAHSQYYIHMCVHWTSCVQHTNTRTCTICEIFMTVFRSHHVWMELMCVSVCARESITKILNPLKLPSLLPTIKPLYALYEYILFIYIEYKLFSNLGICAVACVSVCSALFHQQKCIHYVWRSLQRIYCVFMFMFFIP